MVCVLPVWEPEWVLISHTALLPGDVLKAAAPAVLPLERLGHHADMPVADGTLQGQCASLISPLYWLGVNAFRVYGRPEVVSQTFVLWKRKMKM